MSGNTGTIKITLQIDDKGSVRILQDVGKASSNAGRDGKKSFDDMDASTRMLTGSADKLKSMVLGVAAGFSAYKIVDHVKDVAMAGARYETLGVVMHNVGKIAGYNAKELDMYAEGVKNSGIQMDIARETIIKLSQAHIGLEHASSLARIAQDAAVIGNINSSEALERMVYGIQTAQVEVLRTIGLNVNFEDSYRKLAAQLGKSVSDLDETEKTQARVNATQERGIDIAKSYEVALATAGKQITSFPRLLKDYETSMGMAFNPATADIVGALTETMKLLNEEIVDLDNQSSLAAISQRIADWVVSNNDLIKQDLPTYIKATTGAVTEVMNVMEQVKSIYDVIPSEISGPTGIGIVGAILLGGPTGKFLGMMAAVNQGMDKLFDNNFFNLYGKYKAAANDIQQLFDSVSDAASGKRGWLDRAGSQQAVDNQLNQTRLSNYEPPVMVETTQKATAATKDLTKAQKDLNQEVKNRIDLGKLENDLYAKLKLTESERFEFNIKLLKDEYDHHIKSGVNKNLADRWYNDQYQDLADKRAEASKKVNELENDLYAKSKLTDQERFDFNLKLLQKEYDAHIKTGVDKNVADRWYNDQYQDLVEKRAETSKKTNEKEVQDAQRTAAAIASAMDGMYRDLKLKGAENYQYQRDLLDAQAEKYRQMGVSNELVERWYTERHRQLKEQQTLDSDNFFAGVRIGLQRNQEETQTWAQRGLEITQFATKGMRKAFSDSLFAALKGDIDDISQVWSGFMDSMLHKLTDTVAEMAINWGISAVGGFISGWWDTGAWEVKKDHVAVVHAGEMIVPADVAQLVRDGSKNPREGMSGAQISELAQVSPSGGHEWSAADKRMLASFARGTLGNYAPIAAQGISLFSRGAIDGGTLISGLLNPAAIAQSAFVGGVPTAVNEMLGMRTSAWGTMGQKAASFLGGSFMGPLGAMLGGLMGGTVGMKMGDILNLRGNERYRDMLEDTLKSFRKGVKAYASGGFDYSSFGANAYQYTGYSYPSDDYNPSGYGYSGYDYAGDYNYGGGGGGGGNSGSYGGSSGGGNYERTSSPGGMGGYSGGGVVDRLMLPRGEDGWAPLQFQEGVVSRKGMDTLDKINEGSFAGADPAAIGKAIARELLAGLASSAGQDGTNEIHIHLNVDGHELGYVIAEQNRNNPDVIASIREVA